ncbi:LOW QUALITY PROTEIN: protein FAM156A/FAM156B [Glossophaga mutica]
MDRTQQAFGVRVKEGKTYMVKTEFLCLLFEGLPGPLCVRTQGSSGALSTDKAFVAPLQKCSSTLISESSPMTSEETSQEVTAASHPSSSELLMMSLSDLNPSPGITYPVPVPVPEGLLQQRHTDEKTLCQGQWERPASPRKRTFLGQTSSMETPGSESLPLVIEIRIDFIATACTARTQEGQEKLQLERRQESKRPFWRLQKQWLKEN